MEWPTKSSDQGQTFRRITLDSNDLNPELMKYHEKCIKERVKMIERLSDFDDDMADAVLSDDSGTYSNICQITLKKVKLA